MLSLQASWEGVLTLLDWVCLSMLFAQGGCLVWRYGHGTPNAGAHCCPLNWGVLPRMQVQAAKARRAHTNLVSSNISP